jgi:hypothetical protein
MGGSTLNRGVLQVLSVLILSSLMSYSQLYLIGTGAAYYSICIRVKRQGHLVALWAPLRNTGQHLFLQRHELAIPHMFKNIAEASVVTI